MAEHTPAPWHDDDECQNIWHNNNGRNRGVVLGCGDGIAINNPADRDIILAAPDMYEALCSVHAFMDSRGMQDVGVYGAVCRALDKVWNKGA